MRCRMLIASVLFLLAGLAAAPAPTPTPTPEWIFGPKYSERREEIVHREIPPDIVYPPRDMSDWQRIMDFFVLAYGIRPMHPEKVLSHPWLVDMSDQIYTDCMFGLIHGVQDVDGISLCGRFFFELARRQGVRMVAVEDPAVPEGIRLWRIPRGGRVRIEMPSRFVPEAPRWGEGISGWDYLDGIPQQVEVTFYYVGTAELRFPDPREVPGGRSRFCPPPPSHGPVPVQLDIRRILDDAGIPRSEQERLKETWWARELMEKGVAFVDAADYRLPADWREGEEPWWIATKPEWIGCPYYELVAPDGDALVYGLFLRINSWWGHHYATRFDPRQVFTPMPTVVAPRPTVRPPEPLPHEKASDSRTPSPSAPPEPRRVSVGGWLRVLGVLLVMAWVAAAVAVLLWHLGQLGGKR